jgi:hypothetical protein
MIHSDIEKKEYNIFRELRDSIALDIGHVSESENEMVLIIATNMHETIIIYFKKFIISKNTNIQLNLYKPNPE